MNDWLYLLLIPVLLCLIWIWPGQKNKRTSLRPINDVVSASNNQYHAVSIEPHSHACPAAMTLRGKRFLAAEAMSLPIADCDATICQCTYKHYPDRRDGEDRRHASIAMKHLYSRHEHRRGNDRRRQHVYQ